MSRYFQRRGALLLLAGTALLTGGAAPAQAGVIGSLDWSGAGNHSFQVPPGADTAVVDLYGAQGGFFLGGELQFVGGWGGHVRTTLTLAPGQTWQASVGGMGQTKTIIQAGSGGCTVI